MTEQALLELLSSMSLAEKAGQVSQIPLSACVDGLGEPTGPMMQFNLTPEQVVLCGSLICDRPSDTEENARVVREMTAAHPHHIPPVLMRDIIQIQILFCLNCYSIMKVKFLGFKLLVKVA